LSISSFNKRVSLGLFASQTAFNRVLYQGVPPFFTGFSPLRVMNDEYHMVFENTTDTLLGDGLIEKLQAAREAPVLTGQLRLMTLICAWA
jgi:hypothetical protein